MTEQRTETPRVFVPRVDMRVRVVVDRGHSTLSSRAGTVTQVGPRILGAPPAWAIVRLDGDDELEYRFNAWDLVEAT